MSLLAWAVFCFLILPFILVCSFLYLDVKLLKLQHRIEADIVRIEQKCYYLEKLILITSNSSEKMDFDELANVLQDKTDDNNNNSYDDIYKNRR